MVNKVLEIYARAFVYWCDTAKPNLLKTLYWIKKTAKSGVSGLQQTWKNRYGLTLSQKSVIWISALALDAAAIGNWILNRISIRLADALQPTLMPAYRPPFPSYNSYLLTYVVAIFSILAAVSLAWFIRSAGLKWRADSLWIQRLRWPDPLLFGIVTIALMVGSPSWLSTVFFGMSLVPLITLATTRTVGSVTVGLADTLRSGLGSRLIERLPLLVSAKMIWAGMILLALALGASVWYPIRIPNDYYEIQDTLSIKKSWVNFTSPSEYILIPRSEAIRCLLAPLYYLEPSDKNLEQIYTSSLHDDWSQGLSASKNDPSLIHDNFAPAFRSSKGFNDSSFYRLRLPPLVLPQILKESRRTYRRSDRSRDSLVDQFRITDYLFRPDRLAQSDRTTPEASGAAPISEENSSPKLGNKVTSDSKSKLTSMEKTGDAGLPSSTLSVKKESDAGSSAHTLLLNDGSDIGGSRRATSSLLKTNDRTTDLSDLRTEPESQVRSSDDVSFLSGDEDRDWSDEDDDAYALEHRELTDDEARALWDSGDRTRWTANERKYACLYLRKDLKPKGLEDLGISFLSTGQWQVQAGRLFYHHSYMFVPASHMIKYGLASQIPLVYGLGNTLFHAMLLKIWGATYSTYFNTFPIAQLAGLMALGAVVLYGARSSYAGLAGFGTAVAFLYLLGALYIPVVQLAPGFSPLRYLGIVTQIASIFFLFRGRAWRTLTILLAMGFSFFWNREYAVLGAVGQILALLSPRLTMSRWLRAAVFSLAVVSVGAMLVGRSAPPADSLETTQISYFDIAVPTPTDELFTGFALSVVALALILTFAARRFPPRERDARFCILPIMALVGIKYLFNAAWPHMFFCLILVAPLVLCFLPWNANDRSSSKQASRYRRLRDIAVTIVLIVTAGSAVVFERDCRKFDSIFGAPYDRGEWANLGESFQTPTPEDPIAQRITAVREQFKSTDKLLVLSPFDHLISSYVNPEQYCGHFEIMTNLVTDKNVATVLHCARNSPNVLIVYDIALETPCPIGILANYIDPDGCRGKKLVKATVQSLMDVLKPDAELVAVDGDLRFYRMKPKQLLQDIRE